VGVLLADRVSGPLAPFAAGFGMELAERGCSRDVVRLRMRLLKELSSWMVERSLGLSELNPAVLDGLLEVPRAAAGGRRKWFSPSSERDVVAYLRGLGLMEQPVVPELSAVERLVAEFVEYLVRERGLAENSTSVYWYRRIALSFLDGRVDPETGALASLTAGDVTRFMLSECRHCSRWTGMRLVVGLRGLLRFLFLEGHLDRDLKAAVPRVPAWSLVSLPKALPAGDAARIVASCDRGTAVGRRDLAVLMVLSRMGLRGCEVARITLGDVDWRAGEVIIRGKRDHDERLPLPVDVGDAIVDYLRHGRPS